MKTLILVRHAKSSWKDETLSDFDRPLSKRGKKDAPFMGKLLKKNGIKPDLVVASSAIRALETAEVICKEMDFPKEKLIYDKKLYAAGDDDIIRVINSVNDSVENLMIIAHNPGLTDLANMLSDKFIDNIPTAGVVELKFDESWADVRSQCCTFVSFEYPKKYQDK
ncbi:MAG: histidine phosphatase family protein [Ignavibacteriales bacterium]|nr:MAG: histidine phosphatase family protein [Ignavibacteriales bacterium]